MPTYDYVCDHCGHAFEHFQSITSKPERVCPACGKRTLRRLIGTGAAILVGGRGGGNEAPERSDEARSETKTESSTDAATKTPEKPSEERKISGSTSTPTHEAREGRGVGNLVDAARRQRRESEASRTPKKAAESSKSPAKATGDGTRTAGGNKPAGKNKTTGKTASASKNAKSSPPAKSPRKTSPRRGS